MNAPLPLDRPAYLGLDRDPAWLALLGEGLARYGTHFAGSRRAPYCPEVYEACESAFAAWTSTPATLLLSSASLASVLTLEMLRERRFATLVGPLAHATWRRPGLVAEFDDPTAWRQRVARLLAAGQSVALVTDRVDVLGARGADLTWLSQLGAGRGRLLAVVDDSHALGVLDDGRGTYAALRGGLPPEIDLLTVASLGKAFSSPGALVAGAPWAVRALGDSGGFGGASPLPPAYAHALLHGASPEFPLFDDRRRDLVALVDRVERIGLFGAHVAKHPVFRVDDSRQQRCLREAGIVLSELAYPRAGDPPTVRLVLRADGNAAVAVERVAEAIALNGSAANPTPSGRD